MVYQLKNKNVKIIDKYNLLDVLSNPEVRTWDYIEEIVKENQKK